MAMGVASPWRSRFEPSARNQEGAEAEDGDQRSAGGRPGQLGSVRRPREHSRCHAASELNRATTKTTAIVIPVVKMWSPRLKSTARIEQELRAKRRNPFGGR